MHTFIIPDRMAHTVHMYFNNNNNNKNNLKTNKQTKTNTIIIIEEFV